MYKRKTFGNHAKEKLLFECDTKRAQRDTEFTLQQMLLSGTDAANSVCFLRCQGLDIINEELIMRSERLMFKIEKIDVDDWAGGDWK